MLSSIFHKKTILPFVVLIGIGAIASIYLFIYVSWDGLYEDYYLSKFNDSSQSEKIKILKKLEAVGGEPTLDLILDELKSNAPEAFRRPTEYYQHCLDSALVILKRNQANAFVTLLKKRLKEDPGYRIPILDLMRHNEFIAAHLYNVICNFIKESKDIEDIHVVSLAVDITVKINSAETYDILAQRVNENYEHSSSIGLWHIKRLSKRVEPPPEIIDPIIQRAFSYKYYESEIPEILHRFGPFIIPRILKELENGNLCSDEMLETLSLLGNTGKSAESFLLNALTKNLHVNFSHCKSEIFKTLLEIEPDSELCIQETKKYLAGQYESSPYSTLGFKVLRKASKNFLLKSFKKNNIKSTKENFIKLLFKETHINLRLGAISSLENESSQLEKEVVHELLNQLLNSKDPYLSVLILDLLRIKKSKIPEEYLNSISELFFSKTALNHVQLASVKLLVNQDEDNLQNFLSLLYGYLLTEKQRLILINGLEFLTDPNGKQLNTLIDLYYFNIFNEDEKAQFYDLVADKYVKLAPKRVAEFSEKVIFDNSETLENRSLAFVPFFEMERKFVTPIINKLLKDKTNPLIKSALIELENFPDEIRSLKSKILEFQNHEDEEVRELVEELLDEIK